MARSRPYVKLNAAMTLDGKIATIAGDSRISSRKDIARVHRLRTKVDAILVGINTVLVDDPILTARYFDGKIPARVIVDSKARIKLDSKIMRSCASVPTIIATTKKASRSKLKKIKSYGAFPLIFGKSKVDLAKLLAILNDSGIKEVLVEGGAEINWSLLSQGFVDEVMVTVAPKIVGGKNAVSLVEGKGFAKINKGIRLKLSKATKSGSEVVLFYKVI
ncbi:MAG: 2,5-diamino-6-(ribosylamino)-4(3H)-pyrimidinone 5'-phosphate reductase [Nitrososphaerales archaeon]